MISRRNILKIMTRISSCNIQHVRNFRVLGIETSCDDTGVAVVNDSGKVLGNSLFSQQKIHLKFVVFK